MKERKNRRSKVSDKNKNEKEVSEDEKTSSESENFEDYDSETSNDELKVEKKSTKKDAKRPGRKSTKKPITESSDTGEDDDSKDYVPKRDYGKRSSVTSRKSTLDENEINGEKNQPKKDQRRSNRKSKQMSLIEISDNEDEKDEEEAEEPETHVKSFKKVSKRKKSLKGSDSKKLKADDNEKNGESDGNEAIENSKSRNKKQKAKAKRNTDNENNEEEEAGSEEYEVEKLVDIYFKRNGEREFLVRWKGYSSKDDTWEPEKHLNCKELIDAFLAKCEEAKSIPLREMRTDRRQTDRYMVHSDFRGRKLSQRFKHKPRKNYYEK